jgi:hypothetical protein
MAGGHTINTMDDVTTVESCPPGADRPVGGPLHKVLVPHRRGWRSIVISITVALAVAVTLLITLPRPDAGTVQVVDLGPAVASASKAPDFAVYVPAPLPAGWYPNSVRFDLAKAGPHLHIGYLAPDHGYVGLEETNTANFWRFVTVMTAGAVFRELITMDGNVWTHLQSDRKSQDSLVWYGPKGVVVLTGTTGLANLKALAASLHVGS